MANYLKNLPFYCLDELEFQDVISNSCQYWHDKLFNEDLSNYVLNDRMPNSFNYYTSHQFNAGIHANMSKNILSLTVFHLNIRSLNKNNRGLLLLLEELQLSFDVIVLSEVWAYNIEFYKNVIKGYRFVYSLPQHSKIGGVGIFNFFFFFFLKIFFFFFFL